MELKITHSAGGFGSCGTVALLEILAYFNKHKKAPKINRSAQYRLYADEDVTNILFKEIKSDPIYFKPLEIGDCMSVQWDDYRQLPFRELSHFMLRYFHPSDFIRYKLAAMEEKYRFDYKNLVSVFYRGNDKSKETVTPTYNNFLIKCKEVKARRPNVIFLVQPDESEFLQMMKNNFPQSIHITENIHISKNSSTAVFYTIPQKERKKHLINFFSSLLCHSQCSEIITHSGNIGLWLSLYRGKKEGIHQIYKNKWY